MSFIETEEQKALRQAVAAMAANYGQDYYLEKARAGEHTTELWNEAGKLGFIGVNLPEEYGGGGAGMYELSMVMEEMSAAGSALLMMVVSPAINGTIISKFGTEEQKKRWIPGIADGSITMAFAITEPDAGSNSHRITTTARRDGSDWILDGAKMWITNGGLAQVAIVWAMTDEGIQGFLVERGMPGFETRDIHRKMSLRASVTSALFFDGVRVPEGNRLPGAKGLKGPLGCLTQARYGITWGPIGAAIACFREAVDYTRERVLFGRPVAANQAVQLKLADMARRITAAQLISLHLGRHKDAGTLHPTQVSLAKWNNVRMALDIAREARDLLGGAGITTEHCPIRHALNLESVITYEGTETVHQLVVGRELTGINAF